MSYNVVGWGEMKMKENASHSWTGTTRREAKDLTTANGTEGPREVGNGMTIRERQTHTHMLGGKKGGRKFLHT